MSITFRSFCGTTFLEFCEISKKYLNVYKNLAKSTPEQLLKKSFGHFMTQKIQKMQKKFIIPLPKNLCRLWVLEEKYRLQKWYIFGTKKQGSIRKKQKIFLKCYTQDLLEQ